MGSDKDKAEKKRLKAQVKLEKKQRKAGADTDENSEKSSPVGPPNASQTTASANEPSVPWYKNPEWVRAVVGIIGLIITILALLITVSF